MPTMLDMIKNNAVPANLMAAAAHGSLSMPAVETLQVLVYLTHNRIFGKQARLTLAGWDLEATQAQVADPVAPREVLDYFLHPENIRPKLLPGLIENPAISDDALLLLAAEGSRDVVRALLASPRVRSSHKILHPLSLNIHVTTEEGQQLQSWLSGTELRVVGGTDSVPHSQTDDDTSEEAQAALTAFEREHAAELAAQPDAPFQPIGGTYGMEVEPAEPVEEAPAISTGAAAAAPARVKPKHDPNERVSVLQKIARLDVKGRVQLAVRGTKEERAILVRDGTKLVALAVLQSPKISDGEVEKFAAQKNVLEALLRGITMHRRFMKNYVIIRNLTSNPRTPIDLSLGLVKHLIAIDLKNLSNNKDVSETVRKMALRALKQKSDSKG